MAEALKALISAAEVQPRSTIDVELTSSFTISKTLYSWPLLEQFGVGPIVAATVLCAWSHPGRVHSEAAFAMLAGVAPIPANSGQVTTRYRLNRYGDRHLNTALHTVVQIRIQYQPATRDYVARRTAEGKTSREIKRCLARYVARDLYRLLESRAAAD